MIPCRAWRRAIVVLLLVSLAGCAESDPYAALPPTLPPIKSFTLTERSGKQVRLEDLRGKVWVAHFFFTCCATVCPETTANMKRLHERLGRYPGFRLVSFSLLPENDTPQTLKSYATQQGADPERWLFLTGDEKTIHDLMQKSFFQSVSRASEPKPGFEVNHDSKLVLVDAEGKVSGYVDGRNREEVDRLGRYLEGMLSPGRRIFPPVNATLNGICAVLLVAGYLAIRRRHERLHITCMLLAFLVSIVFLACYLYYHFIVLDGRPTGFRGEGWIRPVYFAVLLSHTILAAVVAPLAIFTVVQGLRDRREKHVRIARWTLPLWLYVSVTGVVVYFMLYHLYPPR